MYHEWKSRCSTYRKEESDAVAADFGLIKTNDAKAAPAKALDWAARHQEYYVQPLYCSGLKKAGLKNTCFLFFALFSKKKAHIENNLTFAEDEK